MDKELQIKNLIKPVRVGKMQLAPNRYETLAKDLKVECLGLVLDESTSLVAGVFGGRSTDVDEFAGSRFMWRPLQMTMDGEDPVQVSISWDDVETYAWEDLDFGKIILALHKGALTSQQATQLGDLPRFFCWANGSENEPILDLLFEKLQKIIALPLDAAWYPKIWNELLSKEYAIPCANYGGFSAMWEVIITQDEWKSLVLSLVEKKVLT